jgi:hypothetical protein
MNWLDFESIQKLFGDALASQVAQFGFAFSMAAWIHSGRMKREIATQVASITTALNNLASALRQDLKSQSERIEKVEIGVNELRGRIYKLEGGEDVEGPH